MGHALAVESWGCVRYADALERQFEAVASRARGEEPDRLFLLEHPPVITLGRSARRENLRASPESLSARGIDLHEVARGGDVTYHAPGQLVGYVVADLAARGEADVHAWLRRIESSLIQALGELGVPGRRIEGMTGVFVDDPWVPRARSPPSAWGCADGSATTGSR